MSISEIWCSLPLYIFLVEAQSLSRKRVVKSTSQTQWDLSGKLMMRCKGLLTKHAIIQHKICTNLHWWTRNWFRLIIFIVVPICTAPPVTSQIHIKEGIHVFLERQETGNILPSSYQFSKHLQGSSFMKLSQRDTRSSTNPTKPFH